MAHANYILKPLGGGAFGARVHVRAYPIYRPAFRPTAYAQSGQACGSLAQPSLVAGARAVRWIIDSDKRAADEPAPTPPEEAARLDGDAIERPDAGIAARREAADTFIAPPIVSADKSSGPYPNKKNGGENWDTGLVAPSSGPSTLVFSCRGRAGLPQCLPCRRDATQSTRRKTCRSSLPVHPTYPACRCCPSWRVAAAVPP
jgi:hypothetical protein